MTHTAMLRMLCLAALFVPVTAAQAQDTHIITDGIDREIELPINTERIVAGFFPFPSAFFIATGSLDHLVAISSDSHNAAERSVFGKIAPGVLELPTNHIEGGVLNAEELLKFNPDVYVTHEGNASIEVAERTGVPTLVLDVLSKGKGNTIQTFANWMGIIGAVTGETTRTGELIDYANQTLANTRAIMGGLDAADRPGALFFARLHEGELKINGPGHFGDFWVTEAGGTNLAGERFPSFSDISMEQVYALDPEVIFITNLSPTLPEDLYENRIPGQDWSHVSAVKNHRVYKIPEGVFQWYVPNGDVPMMLKWSAQKMHPELYADYNFAADLKAYYLRFYDYALTDADVESILNPTF
ncbi:ABC transporter substrate-binding protein [Devosia sp.]|uniref:ABC transporter substrate-binding protein n=1 Tax=Devosia sp. TaxID=1871048 RepID=UPI002732F62C|nr:ABC transporter substrate-binding protein [Devosia sp.]MDP2780455.1 ABC transporter substrate-binding protein [Devosia sp.]